MQTGYLGLIGGLNVKAATVAVMKSIMTTQLARFFNFCGKRGKHGFSALQLKEVVCGWCYDLLFFVSCLQCFDAVGWAAGRAFGL